MVLFGSGSSIDVVNLQTVFPGAKVTKPKAGDKGFTAANGANVPNRGSAIIPARTAEGDDMTAEWKDADVELPILSTKRRTQGGKGVWYHEHGGSVINPNRAIKSDFVESGGVYVIKLLVPKCLTQKGHPPPKAPPAAQGFTGPGAASN